MERFQHLTLKVDFGWTDVIIMFLYILLIYLIAYFIRYTRYHKSPIRKYFIPGMTVKLIGAIAFAFIYTFYYRYGDTFIYFDGFKFLSKVLIEDPVKGLQIMFQGARFHQPSTFIYTSKIVFFRESSTFFVVKIGALLNYLAFNNYFALTLIFGFLSFFGVWRLFLTFSHYKPQLTRQFAIVILFLPSVFFWGSGISKDAITIAALGYFTSSCYYVFILRKNIPQNIIFILISGWLIISIKIYVFLCFFPAIIIWLMNEPIEASRNKFLRIYFKPIFLVTSMVLAIIAIQRISALNPHYMLDYLNEKARITATSIYNISYGEGSAYSLGDDFDFSVQGLIKKFPAAVNVTLYRPYFWEVNNPMILLAAIESFVVFIFTLVTVIRIGPLRVAKLIYSNSFILFLTLFSVAFAFAIGVSTYNFGALVRYKIQFIPFYLSLLILLNSYAKKKPSGRKPVYSQPSLAKST